MKSLAVLNTAEGIIHLIVALIGVWGVIALGQSNIGVWTPIIENFIFGIFSILTGWALSEMGHHHHHHVHNVDNEKEYNRQGENEQLKKREWEKVAKARHNTAKLLRNAAVDKIRHRCRGFSGKQKKHYRKEAK